MRTSKRQSAFIAHYRRSKDRLTAHHERSNESETHQGRNNNIRLPATLSSADRPLYSSAEHPASSPERVTGPATSRFTKQRPPGQFLPHIQAVHLHRYISARGRPDEASSRFTSQRPSDKFTDPLLIAAFLPQYSTVRLPRL
jgi:hypothetical protein